MDTLYQDKILALAKIARASTPLPHVDLTATLNNPVCGDRVTLSVALSGVVITDVFVAVKGCALCEAGAGLLASVLSSEQKPSYALHSKTPKRRQHRGAPSRANFRSLLRLVEWAWPC